MIRNSDQGLSEQEIAKLTNISPENGTHIAMNLLHERSMILKPGEVCVFLHGDPNAAPLEPIVYSDQELEQMKILRSIAHDLRSPMATAIQCMDMIKSKLNKDLLKTMPQLAKSDEYQKVLSFAEMCDNSLTLAFSIVGNVGTIIEASKSFKTKLNLIPFDFPHAVENVCSMLSEKAVEKNIKINTDPGLQEIGNIKADQESMNRVLINLIENAIKYMDREEGGEIQLTGKKSRIDDKEFLEFSVTDNGPGISKNDLPKLFHFAFRSPSQSAKQKGDGIGLWGVERAIHDHGGKILVESKVGIGSTFTFSIPI